ncbi:MAG: NAD(P)-dependent oxidoreductase [Gemmatimonadota bacterium]|nr:NAD(P)-dependent oxidoreductase [Gemmatimonadota bacterium]
MRVLITSAGTALARALAADLSLENDVILTDVVDVSTDLAFHPCDLGHDGETESLVEGMDAIVHVAELPQCQQSDEREIDFQTRCTYNIMVAAREKRVGHVVYLSSLSLFETCDPNWNVTEQWAPRPSTDAGPIGKYLGEFTCREFAREHSVRVTCLRLGEVGGDGDTALSVTDAVRAIASALTIEGPMWRVLHVQSEVENARFPIGQAKEALGI